MRVKRKGRVRVMCAGCGGDAAGEGFRPLLTSADWNAEWKQVQRARRAPDGAAFWDERAKTFTAKDAPDAYVDEFLRLAGVRPGESVLDMGCGTGALSAPLAAAGSAVVAADFSSGMLDAARARFAQAGVAASVEAKLMGWDDDWEACGVGPKSVDVCLASRSLSVADLRSALGKLSRTARRRVCMTVSANASPRVDARALAAFGLQGDVGSDFLYTFNVLAGMGARPEVAYIASPRSDVFGSFEQAHEAYGRMVRDACASEEEAACMLRRLGPWLEDQLVAADGADAGRAAGAGAGSAPLRLREPRVALWAFVAWDVGR